MVLEALVSPQDAVREPWKVAVLGFVFAVVSVVIAMYSGIGSTGVVLVGLASIASMPVLLSMVAYDEEWYENERFLGSRTLARHLPVVLVFAALFLGLTAGFTASALTLSPTDSAKVFDVQSKEIAAVAFVFGGKAVAFEAAFEKVFLHNLVVVVLIVLFSIAYGAGAIAIIAWNSSVIGTFLAAIARSAETAQYGLFRGLSAGILGILPHGSFEMLSYLVAALAGGVLSAGIMHRSKLGGRFVVVLHDSAKLLAAAVLLLAIGAFIEANAIALG